MRWFNDLSITRKMLAGISLAALLTLTLGAFAYGRLVTANAELGHIAGSNVPQVQALGDIRSFLGELRTYMALERPFRVHAVHRYPSWLERYRGPHPPAVRQLWADVATGRFPGVQPRAASDVDRLLASPRYRLGRLGLKLAGRLIYGARGAALRGFYALPRPTQRFIKRRVPALHRLALVT